MLAGGQILPPAACFPTGSFSEVWVQATAGSRKAAKHAKNPKKARLGLSGRDLLLFFALLASFAVPVLYFNLLGIPQLVVRSRLPERKSLSEKPRVRHICHQSPPLGFGWHIRAAWRLQLGKNLLEANAKARSLQ
jgi:hypothetical protein